MSQQKRSRLSPTQKTDIWRRWKSGQSLHEIGRVHGKWHNSIRSVLLPRGGIPPATVAARAARSPWRSEKIYREGLLLVRRFVRLLDDWSEQRPL